MRDLEVWIQIKNQEDLVGAFYKLKEEFGTWKNVANFLGCSEYAIYDYKKGTAIPENIFNSIRGKLSENLNYKVLKVKNKQSLGAIKRNEKYGFNLTTKELSKGIANQVLTTRELQILEQNKKLGLNYTQKLHYTIFRQKRFANFDIAYLKDGRLILVEDVEGSFNRNIKLNWFKLWRFIVKHDMINKPMVLTYWPNYAFNSVMRLILLKNGVLPLEVSERAKFLPYYFENFRTAVKESLERCSDEIKNSIKFTNAGAKGEIKKPYTNEEKLMHDYLCVKYEAFGKQLVTDIFGGFHVVDDFVKINGKEFLVEFFNKNSIFGILQRAIGFCFMVDNIFKKEYGKIIVYKSRDERHPDRFNLGKLLKEKAIVISYS